MQLMLVAIVIFWPESVTHWLDKESVVNTDDVRIEMQIEDTGAGSGQAAVATDVDGDLAVRVGHGDGSGARQAHPDAFAVGTTGEHDGLAGEHARALFYHGTAST